MFVDDPIVGCTSSRLLLLRHGVFDGAFSLETVRISKLFYGQFIINLIALVVLY